MELKELDPHSLTANPWNSNKVKRPEFEKLKQSLTRHGAFKPVVVRELEDGTLQILGGYHRNEAAKELGWIKVPVLVLEKIDDNRAKEISLIDNTRYGQDDQELLEKILADLEDLPAFEDIMPEMVTADIPDEDTFTTDIDDSTTEPEELTKVLKFKLDIDKAEEIEAILLRTADAHDYKYRDGYANLADALYHVLVIEGR